MRRTAVARLLTRHFLRRFLDNDVISPHVDLHENVAMLCAAMVTTTLFISMFLATKTLFGIPTPGVTAIISLSDNFFFLGMSMIVMALVAAVQWDALSLDARDTLNLGALPLARRDIVQAKLVALIIFVAGFALALGATPAVVYQSLLVARIPVGFIGLVRLVGVHFIVAMAASAFGFLTILAFREVMRAVLGQSLFARISTVVQAIVVFSLLSAMLLLPGASTSVSAPAGWAARGFPRPYLLPPLWFLSLSQTLSGGVIVNVTGMRIPSARLQEQNRRGLAMYHANDAFFREMAGVAVFALAVVVVIAVVAYAWNARRLPQPVPSSRGRRRLLALVTAVIGGRHPVTKAGFTFGLHALLRSAPHRLSMVAAAALAIAMAFLLMGRIHTIVTPSYPPLSLLAVQTVVMTILLGGFRRAVRVPAELRANWILQIVWRAGERRFLAGVKRTALGVVAIPALMALLMLHLGLLDPHVARAHSAVGLVFSIVLIEGLFCGYRNVPFASSYQPAGNVKTLGPTVVFFFFLFVLWFTQLERVALQTDRGTILLLAVLAVTGAAFKGGDAWRRRGPASSRGAPRRSATRYGARGTAA